MLLDFLTKLLIFIITAAKFKYAHAPVMKSTCTSIFTPSNSSIYDLIFEPTMITPAIPDWFGYLRGIINSNDRLPVISNSEFHNMLADAKTNSVSQSDYATLLDHAINRRMAASYNITSVYDKFQQLVILSAYFRMLQILSISLQHKIALSNYGKCTKFILTAFTALAPFISMSYIGYISTELVVVSLFTSLSPYILSNRWSNKIREIDLISATKESIFKNSLLNNCLSSIRNIGVTVLLDMIGLFLSSSYLDSHNPQEFDYLAPSTIRHTLEICSLTSSAGNFSYSRSVNTSEHLLTHLLMLEAGWCLGRLAIDIGMGLLQKANIISDARDPFYNSTFKGCPSKPEHMPKQAAARRLKGKDRSEGAETTESHEYLLAQQARQSTRKLKKQEAATHHENKRQVQAERVNEELPIVCVPGYPDQPLVPFYPFAQSAATYGVVANHKMSQFKKFTTTLNKASNRVASPNGFIECLDPTKQVFSIRPNNSDARVLGQKATGQEDVGYALKSVYNYEQIWATMEKILIPSVVSFTKETNHAQQNSVISRFA